MTRSALRLILLISICIVGILYLPKFNKPPLEFQTRASRLLIEYSFYTFIGIAVISTFLLIAHKWLKIFFGLIGLPLMVFVLIGFFFTRMNNGNTYNDIGYYKSNHNKYYIILQYYDEGAYGSHTRYILTKSINKKIRLIKDIKDFSNQYEWIEIDKNGIEIRK